MSMAARIDAIMFCQYKDNPKGFLPLSSIRIDKLLCAKDIRIYFFSVSIKAYHKSKGKFCQGRVLPVAGAPDLLELLI